MNNLIVKAILVLALPTVVFISGAFLMSKLSGREYVTHFWEKAKPEVAKPLNQRIVGYNLEEVSSHWSTLNKKALVIEQCFLRIDLVFPFFYGAALTCALLLAWVALDRPFHPAWPLLPVAVMMVSDWTENLVQITQLQLFVESGKIGLQPWGVQIASAATVVKLVSSLAASSLLVSLALWMVARAIASPS